MVVTINGEKREVPERTTALALIQALQLNAQATIVQRNGDVLERSQYADTMIEEGDVLELVRFVGGG